MKIKSCILITLSFISLWFNICAAKTEERPTLRVGTSADYAPFSFIDKGEITGFDIELVKEIAKRLNYSLEIIDMPFKTLLPTIQLGKLDLIAAGLSETEERAKQVLFLPPHLAAAPFIVLTKGQNVIQDIADLNGKTVIVNDGYITAQYMQQFPLVKLQYLKSPSDAIAALNAAHAYAFVTTERAMLSFFKNSPIAKDFHVFHLKNTGEATSLAVSKSNAALFAAAKKVLMELQAEGFIEKLQQKWGL